MSSIHTRRVRAPKDFQILETLFREYTQTLGIDLSFQNFQAELENLENMYGSDGGAAVIALCDEPDCTPPIQCTQSSDGDPGSTEPQGSRRDTGESIEVGCVGIRRLTHDTCEIKRLYVRPHARRWGVGTRLATEAVDIARTLGYSRVVLDTLSTMKAAMQLYVSLGFEQTEPYYNNPLPNAVYFEKWITL